MIKIVVKVRVVPVGEDPKLRVRNRVCVERNRRHVEESRRLRYSDDGDENESK